MERMESAASSAAPNLLGLELERQLHVAESRYAEACHIAEKAREELRALLTRAIPQPAAIAAARAKFEAVAARCSRLLKVIDELQERIEA